MSGEVAAQVVSGTMWQWQCADCWDDGPYEIYEADAKKGLADHITREHSS